MVESSGGDVCVEIPEMGREHMWYRVGAVMVRRLLLFLVEI